MPKQTLAPTQAAASRRQLPVAEAAPTYPDMPAQPDQTAESSDAGTVDQDRLRAALRELERAKQRVERDAQQAADTAREKLLAQLFPVFDNLTRSLDASQSATDTSDDSLREGVKLVHDQFASVLCSYGLERIDAVGSAFDPTEHDAVAVQAVDDHRKDGVVLDQWEPGYRLGDRVLRPAKVRVGKLAS